MFREFLVLALTAFCLTKAMHVETHTADMEFLHKQKKIYELFFYLDQKMIVGSEIYEIGHGYDIEANMEKYTDKMYVKEFLYRFKYGMLERGALFSVYYKEHRHEVLSLFRLLYSAKDFETFYKTACWARYYMNEGMFVTAFTTAVIYRPDCKYIQLPPFYEVYPQFFFNNKIIQEAHTMKMMMMSGSKKEMTKDYEMLIKTTYSKKCMKPVVKNEYELDYFVEDIGLNNYYYYFRTAYPFWLKFKDFKHVPKFFRGELYYFMHRQFMSRYYLERLSNGMEEIEDFDFTRTFMPAYYSNLVYPNGVSVPKRDFWSNVPYYKYKYVNEFENIEMRILAAIDSGFILGRDGNHIGIYTPEGLDLLGNIIEGNYDSDNVKFYGSVDALFRDIFGFNYDCKNKNCVVPSVLQTYSMNMRDPAFYRLYKRILNYFLRYKYNLEPYTKSELDFTGVKIENVMVDKIHTFFEEHDSLINNVVTVDNWKEGVNLNIKTRQHRLNYKPFTYRFNVKSDIHGKGMVRIFMGPSFEHYANEYEYFKNNWMNFYELDKFVVTLKPGMNNIERLSTDSFFTMKDIPTGDMYYKKMLKAIEGGEPFTYTERMFGFPDRLQFPKGRVGGMKYKLFFYISPIDDSKFTTYDLPMFGKMHYDGKPMGYPLDRPLYPWYLDLPNLFIRDVMIYHLKGEEAHHMTKELTTPYHGKYEKVHEMYGKHEKYSKYERPMYEEEHHFNI